MNMTDKELKDKIRKALGAAGYALDFGDYREMRSVLLQVLQTIDNLEESKKSSKL